MEIIWRFISFILIRYFEKMESNYFKNDLKSGRNRALNNMLNRIQSRPRVENQKVGENRTHPNEFSKNSYSNNYNAPAGTGLSMSNPSPSNFNQVHASPVHSNNNYSPDIAIKNSVFGNRQFPLAQTNNRQQTLNSNPNTTNFQQSKKTIYNRLYRKDGNHNLNNANNANNFQQSPIVYKNYSKKNSYRRPPAPVLPPVQNERKNLQFKGASVERNHIKCVTPGSTTNIRKLNHMLTSKSKLVNNLALQNRPGGNSFQAPIQVPAQRPFQAPVQRPFQSPVQQPFQAPVQQPFQAPVQRPNQAPVQRPFQAPAHPSGWNVGQQDRKQVYGFSDFQINQKFQSNSENCNINSQKFHPNEATPRNMHSKTENHSKYQGYQENRMNLSPNYYNKYQQSGAFTAKLSDTNVARNVPQEFSRSYDNSEISGQNRIRRNFLPEEKPKTKFIQPNRIEIGQNPNIRNSDMIESLMNLYKSEPVKKMILMTLKDGQLHSDSKMLRTIKKQRYMGTVAFGMLMYNLINAFGADMIIKIEENGINLYRISKRFQDLLEIADPFDDSSDNSVSTGN
jgi:hypothetical protein